MPKKERQQQCSDMAAIHISVGHDNHFVIANFFNIHLMIANASANRRDQRADFSGRQHFIKTGTFNIQNFTTQRQNRLIRAIPTLLGRSPRRVTLDQKHLRFCRVTFLTISQLSGQARHIHNTLAAG